ncbi:MAG: hypothetical protein A2672_02855 [Candidatus Wildermuthbacteria bacterium RIFCSPHIGHO2_01_FULL_49_22b]|uniref:Uncharacterized protein n=1 Tax=Candidatus Wildermuthbacteria bacterium RIFCSPHIGHO2_01_FULL_49_22b TaxID=1802448 RepID=A0A1G2QVH5_9BACT|nr:MAG: hypothetical protein A2672_02855 [Candidatus Wildermuthbacteria bacterium RIFCSPHIGHO2_01_FULL_49_22b]
MEQENQGRFQRPMVEGNWTCADCGTAITQLPFNPRPGTEGNLRCNDCWRKNRPPRRDFQN